MSPFIQFLGLVAITIGFIQFLSELLEDNGSEAQSDTAGSSSRTPQSSGSGKSNRGTRKMTTPTTTSKSGTDSKSSTERTTDNDQKLARSKVDQAAKSADSRLQRYKNNGNLRDAAVESYLLADSLEKMFYSDQYFGEGTQIKSYSTALDAAEDARNNLIDLTADRTHGIDLSRATPERLEREYKRNVVASALMIAWCAGGLVGKSKLESARLVFQTPVARSDTTNWDGFKRALNKECSNYGAH